MKSFKDKIVKVNSKNVQYKEDSILSNYTYNYEFVSQNGDEITIEPKKRQYYFKTERKIPKVGFLLVGIGGNNGTTMIGGIIANRDDIKWKSKKGHRNANFFGSITQCSTTRIGFDKDKHEIFVPLRKLVPFADPCDFEFGGWDINNMNLGDAIERAAVFPNSLQLLLKPKLKDIVPWKSIFIPDFIAGNQADRANNVLTGTIKEQFETIRKNMRDFKKERKLDKVIVLWTANTERFADIVKGVNDTGDNLLKSIENYEKIKSELKEGETVEISPSTLFATAAILEGFSYINGSPQNTFVPGVIELANKHDVYIAGDDFKSGQTKLKSVLVEFLVDAGIQPKAIVSYNHLGNNDGKNLAEEKQFKSKEISKSNVIDDMVHSNPILFKEGEKPDHVVVIKYVPTVGDSKKAMDEYTSQIFMGGTHTLVIHNTCEDSLLAAPLMIDLIVLTEFMERVKWKTDDEKEFLKFNPVLSILSYLFKAPMVPKGTPVVNALFKQRLCIENLIRALIAIPPQNNMLLEQKCSKQKY